jgi:hypothetical protein
MKYGDFLVVVFLLITVGILGCGGDPSRQETEAVEAVSGEGFGRDEGAQAEGTQAAGGDGAAQAVEDRIGGSPGEPSPAEGRAAGRSRPGSLVFTGADTLWNHRRPLGTPVAVFGDPAPEWTVTTLAAADRGTTGKPTTVVGEVVSVSCYLQLGKRGEAHAPCGADCVGHGASIGLVDAGNELYIVVAEEHDPRRYGNVALKEAMIPFMAKTVQVSGMLTERDGVKALFVQGYTVGEHPNQPRGN